MDTCNACNVNAILLQMYVENQVHANKQNSGFFISSRIFELGVIQTVFFFLVWENATWIKLTWSLISIIWILWNINYWSYSIAPFHDNDPMKEMEKNVIFRIGLLNYQVAYSIHTSTNNKMISYWRFLRNNFLRPEIVYV